MSTQDVLDLVGHLMIVGPVRLKCALLPLKVMKSALYGIEKDE
jgi:hypothetical protein